MVRGSTIKSVTGTVLLIAVVICSALLLSGSAVAQEESAEPTIAEEYKVTVNEVGDAKIQDTLEYSDEDFDVMQSMVEENPTFLTRKYTSGDNIIEVENFEAEMNDADNSVVITFDSPGYAYHMQDYWVLYGYGVEPTEESEHQLEFVQEGTVNSEFTLFTDQLLESTTVVVLPQESTNARYNSEDSAIEYDMPAASAALGFWNSNRILLTIIFGACAVFFLIMLILVASRKTVAKPGPAPAAAFVPPPMGPQVPGPIPGRVSAPVLPTPPTPPAPSKQFCTNCGSELQEGKKFCTNCGSGQE